MAEYQLVVLSNPAPGREVEYNEWYDTIHLGEMLQVPGVVSVKRLAADPMFPTSHGYLALYLLDTDDPQAVMDEVAASAARGAIHISDALGKDVQPMMFRLISEAKRS